MKDYVPHSDSDLIGWSNEYFGYLTPHAAAWAVDAANVTALQSKFGIFNSYYNQYHNPETHTPMNRERKDEAKDAYIADLRTFNQAYLIHNPLLTDADRIALGLTVPKSGQSSASDPDTYPVIKRFVIVGAGWIDAHFQDKNEDHSTAKPADIHGAELKWGLYNAEETLPTNADELPYSDFSTRTPFRFKLPASAHAKILCVATRWENNRGVKGPWAPNIEKTVVE
ncbi:MAG: hypothetical protein LBP64_03540 [Tannerella sp.]|jgi:hypothetical protein|nr:hypothetical protein [Tannerella sp.]